MLLTDLDNGRCLNGTMKPNEKLRQLREEKKREDKSFSLRGMAKKLRIDHTTYKDWEDGLTELTLPKATKAANALEVDPRIILFPNDIHNNVTGLAEDSNLTIQPRVDDVRAQLRNESEADSTDLGTPSASMRFPAPQSSGRKIPVLGTALGGQEGCFIMNGQIIDYLSCPAGLENVPNAFAVYTVGDSMWPRYMDGEPVFVNPNPHPKRDDFVLIEMNSPEGENGAGFIKWFKGVSGNKASLEQFNPPKKFKIDMSKIKKISVIYAPGR